MLRPDNFFYFITVFFICTSLGTYLLFSYKRNSLIILNAIACFLTAIRACTEYYLPQVNDFTVAGNIAAFHSIVLLATSSLFYYIVWFYIRPFRFWKQEYWLNRFYLYGILVLNFVVTSYNYFQRKIFYFNPEKIDGYWQFKIHLDYYLSIPIVLFQQFLGYSMLLIFLVSIIRERQYWLQKSLLAFSFFIFPFVVSNYFLVTGTWMIPNIAIIYTGHLIIVTWFVSEYRLFQNNFTGTLKDLLNSISDLAVFTDLKMNILHSNKLAQNHFSSHLLAKKNIVEVIANYSYQSYQEIFIIFQELMLGSNDKIELELVFDQQIKKYNLQVSDYNQGNRHQGYTFLLTDLTEIREKEQQLAAVNATKDRLFAIISHDLRKPALAFRGISKKVKFLLQNQDFKTIDKYGIALEKAAFSLNNLLDNLLNWALQQRSVLPYKPVPIDVAHITEEIYDFFNQIAEDKGITLEMKVPESTIIFADQNAYTTIIRNLLDNALKYTPVGGSVEITAENNAENVVVKIEDTGIGIEQDKIDALFDLKADKSFDGTEGEKGTGLGLTLVKDLVKLNKGDIKIKSEWNRGTVFEVILPSMV